MVKESVPAFFLVIEYDERPYPQRAYLVHVGGGAHRGRTPASARGERREAYHRAPSTVPEDDENPEGPGLFGSEIERRLRLQPNIRD
jgi:hypothetical protein